MSGSSGRGWTRAGSRWRRAGASGIAGAVLLVAGSGAVAAQESAAQEAATATAKHEVRRGDTLWGLAGRYLANPFLWPQIYELNRQVIENPHWIFPGERLALPDAVAVSTGDRLETRDAPRERDTSQEAPAGRAGVSGFGGSSLFDRSPDVGNVMGGLDIETYRAPVLVSQSDFYRAPLLVDRDAIRYTARTVRKIQGNPLGLTMPPGVRLNDIVILELESLQVVPGDRLRAFRMDSGPDDRRIVRSLALLTVEKADDEIARARVVQLFDHYKVGDPVMLAEPWDLPETLAQAEADGDLEATLIGFEIEQPLLGQGDMVFFDRGADQGVSIGDEFAVFETDAGSDALLEDRLATVRIVRVTPETATGRVVDLHEASPRVGAPARRTLRAIAR